MFIQRNFDRTENDDFKLNVEPVLGNSATNYKKEAVPQYGSDGKLVGWKIQSQYE